MANAPPPYPINETLRQQAVNELRALEHSDDEVFELIVGLAAAYFAAPIVLISIVDEQRQWFSARVGLDVTQTPRDVSFCAHALSRSEVLEIEDASQDERFKHNPLVTGAPGIRYYAGAPLMTAQGLGLGTLCLIDTQPRPAMSEAERGVLQRYAQLVMRRIEGLRCEVYVDAPTGLLNRTRIEQDIVHCPSPGDDRWLVAVDTMTPTFLNDIVKALGYSFMQALVLALKQRLLQRLPPECALYRISPTRFAFFWPLGEPVAPLCTALARDFDMPVSAQGIPLKLEVTLGLLNLGSYRDNRSDALRTVITAAEDARTRGVAWCEYQPELDAAQQRAFLLLTSLAQAIHLNDQLSLVYQPRIDLKTGACTSVEALLRWEHPTLGWIGPAEFIPLAEKTALIRPLSTWVLHAAIRQVSAWRTQSLGIKVAINVTAQDVSGPAFIDLMFELMAHHDVDPGSFELEFTESTLIANPQEVSRQLQRVRTAGIDVAIDDFGTGYSNWTYLRQLPATTVKLDQSLIRNIHSEEKDKRVVQTLISLAKKLRYRVVAEGIETAEQLSAVREWGCDEAQGYLIAMPMTSEQLLTWFSTDCGTAERSA